LPDISVTFQQTRFTGRRQIVGVSYSDRPFKCDANMNHIVTAVIFDSLVCPHITYVGRDSSIGMATGYWLDGPGIESRWGRDFPHLSRPVLVPTQPPVQWIPGLFPGVKSGRGVTLTPHPLVVPWSRKGRAIPLLPLWAVRPVQSLSACTRGALYSFTFTLHPMYCLFCVVLCIVCVYMCIVLLPPGGYPIAVKYIVSDMPEILNP